MPGLHPGPITIATSRIDVSCIQLYTHEEADYQMILHISNVFDEGYHKIRIWATNTDVVV